MLISELAAATNETARTLRFYETAGVLPEPPRTCGRYRDYPDTAIARVRLIRSLQSGDLTLDEIATVVETMLTDLATNGPSADEFGRAFEILENEWSFVGNGDYLTANLANLRFPDLDLLEVDDRLMLLSRATRDDVRALAAALFGDAASVRVDKVLP